MYWTYRIIKGKQKVYIGEVMYDKNDKPIMCTEEPEPVTGYDYEWNPEDTDRDYNVLNAAKDLTSQLKMMLKDIKKFPEVIDPETDLVGKLPSLEGRNFKWEYSDYDIQD